MLSEAIDRDSASFDHVMAAYKLPKETSNEQVQRDAAIQLALQGAANVPLEVARRSAEVFELLGRLESISAASMHSDVRVGRLMAAAGARGALENVAINLESITDQRVRQPPEIRSSGHFGASRRGIKCSVEHFRRRLAENLHQT